MGDVKTEISGVFSVFGAPDGGEDGLAGDELPGVADEDLDELPFRGGEADLFLPIGSVSGDAVRGKVDGYRTEMNDGGGVLWRDAAGECADAGKEFFYREGLGDVVIRTSVEGCLLYTSDAADE